MNRSELSLFLFSIFHFLTFAILSAINCKLHDFFRFPKNSYFIFNNLPIFAQILRISIRDMSNPSFFSKVRDE
jgi:hypothetical protein